LQRLIREAADCGSLSNNSPDIPPILGGLEGGEEPGLQHSMPPQQYHTFDHRWGSMLFAIWGLA
jgi:hypothetical protein